MDKENEREAFEAAVAAVWGTPMSELHPDAEKHIDRFWKAACKYQREKDAEICRTAPIKTARQDIRDACSNAILNQGSKE